ncbi:MAG: hypothetical protein ACYDHF_05875 [Candidatus Cryosericum sp.]
MIYPEYSSNPLAEYLRQEHLMPGDFARLADVDQSKVYEVLHGRVKTLPQSYVRAIDERSGPGAGAKIREAYSYYREDLRAQIPPAR